MTTTINILARDLTAAAARTTNRTIVGIVGAPGAGKSTLTEALAEHAGAVWVPMDGFHLSNRELNRLGRRDRKGASDTFDALGYASLLQRIRTRPDEEIYAPDFDRTVDESIAGSIRIGPENRLIVTEGNYLLLEEGGWERVWPQVHEIWYLDVPEDVRTERLISRHMRFGMSTADAAAWVERVDAVNARAVVKSRYRADRLISDWE